jgi:hypothetical protein
VIGQCYQRHRHQELLRFLRTLDQELPGEVPTSDSRQLWDAQAFQREDLAETRSSSCSFRRKRLASKSPEAEYATASALAGY